MEGAVYLLLFFLSAPGRVFWDESCVLCTVRMCFRLLHNTALLKVDVDTIFFKKQSLLYYFHVITVKLL